MEGPRASKSSSRLHGSSIFTKSQNSEKYEKVRKRNPKSDPRGGGNRLGDPICLRVGGLAAPAGTNMCPYGSTMQKMSKAGLPETKKLVQDTEKQRKACLESAQKRPSAEKERASFVRGSKNTGEHHRRAAGAPENRRRASEKTREEQRTTSYTKTKEHTRYRNLCALIASRWGAFL